MDGGFCVGGKWLTVASWRLEIPEGYRAARSHFHVYFQFICFGGDDRKG